MEFVCLQDKTYRQTFLGRIFRLRGGPKPEFYVLDVEFVDCFHRIFFFVVSGLKGERRGFALYCFFSFFFVTNQINVSFQN